MIVASCSSPYGSKSVYQKSKDEVFDYFEYKDTIQISVIDFVSNKTYCYTEGGIPYAVVIGRTEEKDALPHTISVLAICDNNAYKIGQMLKVVPVNYPSPTTLKPIYITKDTVINNQLKRWVIGSQYPAVWGKIVAFN